MTKITKFDAYKKIKDKSLFNILPESFHDRILESSTLVVFDKNQNNSIKDLSEALYIVISGEIELHEKNRKLDHKIKSIIQGRSVELENFIKGYEPEFRWKINQETVALEINRDEFFNILDEDEIFKSYLTVLLTSFELRKLKNDLRLFGFSEREIQSTFYCLELHDSSLNNIDNAICIISKANISFYYFYNDEKKLLGDFIKGDFFLWTQNRKLNYDIDDNFQCWKLEYNKWIKYIDPSKAQYFMQLSDPLKGRFKTEKGDLLRDTNEVISSSVNQPKNIFFEEEEIDYELSFIKCNIKHDYDYFLTLNLIKTFQPKVNLEYVKLQLPTGKDGASLYHLQDFFNNIGFDTYLGLLSPNELKKVKWPFILRNENQNCLVYEKQTRGYLTYFPKTGKKYLSYADIENIKKIVLIVKPTLNIDDDLTINTRKSYLNIVKSSRWNLFFILISSIIIFALELITPIYTQIIFDDILINKDLNLLIILSIVTISILFISTGMTLIRSLLLTIVTTTIDIKFSSAFFSLLLKLNRKFYEKYSTGQLISRINELKRIRKFFTAKSINLLIDLISSTSFMVLIAFYNIQLLFFILASIPMMLIYLRILTPKLNKSLHKLFETSALAQDFLTQHLRSLSTIKTNNMNLKAHKIWSNSYDKNLIEKRRIYFLNILLSVGSDFFLQFVPLIVTMFAIHLHLNKELTLGQVIASSTIISFIIYPIINLFSFIDDYKQVLVSFSRVNDVIESSPEEKEKNLSHFPKQFSTILFNDVSFKYGNEASRLIINNFNAAIKIGNNYGIVGNSGTGKSTIMKLLVSKEVFIGGEILINDINHHTISINEIRDNIIYVDSVSNIFSGTIIDNISLCSEIPNLEKVIEVAKVADAHSFISSLPNGYMTKLGEDGQGLSLGQKQRINIARALYNKPQVIILDEATSTLDLNSERLIFQNIKDYLLGKTIIFISHRLDVLQMVDEIFVVSHGRVVEKGKHKNLMLNQSHYFEIWNDSTYSKT